MKTDYFEKRNDGILFVQETISKLEIKVTEKSSAQDIFLYNNAITAYVVDTLMAEIKKHK